MELCIYLFVVLHRSAFIPVVAHIISSLYNVYGVLHSCSLYLHVMCVRLLACFFSWLDGAGDSVFCW